jgi:DNA-directed RNA polymerase delta subunit
MSHIDMAHDVLKRTKVPLHISELIRRIESVHGVRLDRESLVSALTKKVARSDRFIRTGKNTFALRESVE